MNNIRPEVKRVLDEFQRQCGSDAILYEEGIYRAPRLVCKVLCRHFQYPKLLRLLERSAYIEVERFMDAAVAMNESTADESTDDESTDDDEIDVISNFENEEEL